MIWYNIYIYIYITVGLSPPYNVFTMYIYHHFPRADFWSTDGPMTQKNFFFLVSRGCKITPGCRVTPPLPLFVAPRRGDILGNFWFFCPFSGGAYMMTEPKKVWNQKVFHFVHCCQKSYFGTHSSFLVLILSIFWPSIAHILNEFEEICCSVESLFLHSLK